MSVGTVIVVVAAALAPLGAYLVAARQFSGKVKTSDASELWAESTRIRKWSSERIGELNNTVNDLESRVKELEHSNGSLEDENRTLKRELAECRGV